MENNHIVDCNVQLDIDKDLTYFNPIYVLDHYFLRQLLPIINPRYQNPVTIEKLYRRNEQILIPLDDQMKMSEFAKCVRLFLERIIFSEHKFKFFAIEEVGSYKKNVMINQKPYVLDILAMLDYRNFSVDHLDLLEKSIQELLEQTVVDLQLESFNKSDCSFKLSSKQNPDIFKAKIFIGLYDIEMFHRNGKSFFLSSKINSSDLNEDLVKRIDIYHRTKWFTDTSTGELRLLVRLFKDLKRRFRGFEHFDQFMMEVLLNYCIRTRPFSKREQERSRKMFNHLYRKGKLTKNRFDEYQLKTRKNVDINDAFLRAFQLLSAGIFLPDSVSICDPTVLSMRKPVHHHLNKVYLDQICCTAQTLLRIMNYRNGFDVIIGLMMDDRNIEEDITMWDGIVVQPSIPIFAYTQNLNDNTQKNSSDEGESGNKNDPQSTK